MHDAPWTIIYGIGSFIFKQNLEWSIFGIHFLGIQFTRKKIVLIGQIVKIVVSTGEQRI